MFKFEVIGMETMEYSFTIWLWSIYETVSLINIKEKQDSIYVNHTGEWMT